MARKTLTIPCSSIGDTHGPADATDRVEFADASAVCEGSHEGEVLIRGYTRDDMRTATFVTREHARELFNWLGANLHGA